MSTLFHRPSLRRMLLNPSTIVFLISACLLWGTSQSDALGQNEFEDWKQQQEAQFQDFKNEQDAAFMEMLEEAWEFIDTDGSSRMFEDDKFEQIPQASEATEQEHPGKTGEADAPPEPDEEIEIELPPVEETGPRPEQPAPRGSRTEASEALNEMQITFYETHVSVLFDEEFTEIEAPDTIDEEFISAFWGHLATADYEPVLDYLQSQKKHLQLNDWGYGKLTYHAGLQLYDGNTELANLFSWFMLTQSGYAVRVGYDQDRLHLLLAIDNPVYAARYYTFDDRRYYAVSFDGTPPETGSLHTYGGDFSDTDQLVSMGVSALPHVQSDMTERNLSFEYRGTTYEVSVPVNRNLIDFYEYYPQTNLEVYFDAPVTTETSRRLLEQLKEVIEGQSEVEALNLLLRFSQTAFGYKVDPENFGREKPLFPEETLYYDYSDCEDRAIMFRFLVTHLLDAEVVGLNYPNHIATAVRTDREVAGNYIMYNGERYYVADPTYVNADLGMEMPAFRDVEPEIISLGYQ